MTILFKAPALKTVMRKFTVAQPFLCYLENYRKTYSSLFSFDDQECKFFFAQLPILCTPVRVQFLHHQLSFSRQIIRYLVLLSIPCVY